MAMTSAHQDLYASLGGTASTLDEKVAAYVAAKAVSAQAEAELVTATAALDAAVSAFKSRNVAFDTAMLTFPAGYTPPV